jgi:hypothetical protein
MERWFLTVLLDTNNFVGSSSSSLGHTEIRLWREGATKGGNDILYAKPPKSVILRFAYGAGGAIKGRNNIVQ